jgi:hypothetical protein
VNLHRTISKEYRFFSINKKPFITKFLSMKKNYKQGSLLKTLMKQKQGFYSKISLFLFLSIFLSTGHLLNAQVLYSTPGSNYIQYFDSIYAAGSVPANNTVVAGSVLPSGWLFLEALSNANTTLRVHNGTGSTGDTYLAGPTSSIDRALGGLSSGSLTTHFGVKIVNTTGTTLSQFTLTYRGEQWKDGGSSASIPNADSFSYGFNTGGLTSGTYTKVSSLDFLALVSNISTDVSLDGNDGANRRLLSSTVTGITWLAGDTLYLRWQDVNDLGNDDILAIDSVVFSAAASSVPSIAIGTSHPTAYAINQGSADNIIGAYSLAVTLNTATLNGFSAQTAGSYSTSADFTNFKFWLSSSASSVSGATQLGSTLASVASGGTLSVSGLTNTISAGTTRYILVTTSVSASGTVGRTLGIASDSFSNFTFATGTITGTNPAAASTLDTIVSLPPSIALSDASPVAGTINQSSTNNILRSIQLNVTSATATLNSVSVNTGGTYVSSDLQSNSFKVWYNTSNSLSGATQLGSNQPIVTSGGAISVSGLSQTIPLGLSYILISTDVSYNADPSRYINIASTSHSSLSFATGSTTGTDPVAAGNDQTFGVVNPSIAVAQIDTLTANFSANNINKSIYQLRLAVTSNSTNLTSLKVTTAGTYVSGDFVADSMKLYFNTTNSLASATKLANRAVVASGDSIIFSGLDQFIAFGTTVYVWVTADVAAAPVTGNTISTISNPLTSVQFSAGTKTGTDPARAGALKTIVATLKQEFFTGVIVPQHMSSGTSTRLPFSYRATVSNLSPSTTYRYFTNAAISTDFGGVNPGAGNPLFINSSGSTFTYSTSASLTSAGNYSTFTTDTSGIYTGWFSVVNTGNARFTGGNTVYPTIAIGDDITGATVALRILNDSVKVLAYSTSAGANNGSFLKEDSSSAIGKNFVAIYDNESGTGKPVYVAPIQNIGVTIASVVTGFTTGAGGWNAIIPNNNANGIRRIEQRDFSGNILCYSTDADGLWTTGSINTVNPTNGTTARVISRTDAPLGPPVISSQPVATQTVCQTYAPTNLSVIASSATSYAWYVNTGDSIAGGSLIGGAVSSTYTPSTVISGTKYYYCEVISTCSRFSNVVSVTVLPSVTGSFSQTICPSGSYFFNGVDVSVAGSYLDTLSNISGCDSVVTLNLSIITCPLIPNDSRCAPIAFASTGVFHESAVRNLASNNPDCDTIQGSTLGAGSEFGEVFGSAAGFGGTQHTVWYSMTAPTCAASSVRFSTNTSPTNYDTRLTAYHRAVPSICSSGYIELASVNDDLFSPIPSASSIVLTPGSGAASSSTYAPGQPIYVQVSGFSGAYGDYGIIVDVDAPDLTIGTSTSSSINVNLPSAALAVGPVSNIYLRYRIAGTTGSSYGQITLPSGTTTATISGLTSGASYDIWAMYRCTADDRWVTRKITASTVAGCTASTSPIVDTSGSCTSVRVSWTTAPLVSRYVVYWRVVGYAGYGLRRVDSLTTSTVISGLTAGANYEFWVSTVCTGGAIATSVRTPFSTCGALARRSDATQDIEEGIYAYNNLEFHHMPITDIANMIEANDPTATEVKLSGVNGSEEATPTVSNLTIAEHLSIYPNPAQTEATIGYLLPTESDMMTIRVFDVQGKEMMNEVIKEPSMIGSYDIQLNNYAGGIYFVKVQANNFSETRKLIVDKD